MKGVYPYFYYQIRGCINVQVSFCEWGCRLELSSMFQEIVW